MKLWQVGLLLVISGSCVNGLLVTRGIHGLSREGMRLLILTGIVLFIVGLVKSKKNKSKNA